MVNDTRDFVLFLVGSLVSYVELVLFASFTIKREKSIIIRHSKTLKTLKKCKDFFIL